MLIWEVVKCELMTKSFFASVAPTVFRAKVPGGWFVKAERGEAGGAFFYPDPEHL